MLTQSTPNVNAASPQNTVIPASSNENNNNTRNIPHTIASIPAPDTTIIAPSSNNNNNNNNNSNFNVEHQSTAKCKEPQLAISKKTGQAILRISLCSSDEEDDEMNNDTEDESENQHNKNRKRARPYSLDATGQNKRRRGNDGQVLHGILWTSPYIFLVCI